MAAASDGMFESSARSDWPLKSLEVESAHSSRGRSKKWSKLSPAPSPPAPPPPPPPPPPPKRLGRRVKRRLRVQTKTKVVAKDATWVVVLVQPFVRAKYALYYLCAKEIVNIRDCVFWIRLKHRMIVEHCRVRRSFYRFTKNKAQPTRLSHNSFNKETGFSWKIRREWPESSLPSCQACRLTASLSKGFVMSKASLVIL